MKFQAIHYTVELVTNRLGFTISISAELKYSPFHSELKELSSGISQQMHQNGSQKASSTVLSVN